MTEGDKDCQDKCLEVGNALKSLQTNHYVTSKCLFLHLFNVKENSKSNLMVAGNLAVVFGPTIFKSSGDRLQEMCEQGIKSSITEFLITNACQIFSSSSSKLANA